MKEAKTIKKTLMSAMCKNGLNEATIVTILAESNSSLAIRHEDRLIVRCGAESDVIVDATFTSAEPDAKATMINIFSQIE